jgi:transposase-like protein
MQKTPAEPMEPSEQFCPNLACCARGKRGLGNIAIPDRQRQRYRCKMCKHTFSARRGTMFEGLRTATDVVVIVVTLLAFGCPVQAIVQAYGLDERTVASWRDRAGLQCQRVHQAIVEQGQLDLIHVQADEIGVKARGMVAWMGLCAVSVHVKFLRNAGEGESKTSRTPNLPGVETQREK